MRFSLCLFLLSTLITHLHAAEYGSLYIQATSAADINSIVSDVITLNDGDQFEVIGAAYWGDDYRLVARDERASNKDAVHQSNDHLKGTIIVGPCLVGIKQVTYLSASHYLRISYKLTRKPDPQAVSTPPAN